MSITGQKPGPAGLVNTSEADALLGEAAHYGGEKSPSAGQRLAPLRELIDDRLLDALLERSRDQAGGLRLTGEGSMLGELVKAVLERALEAELTAHLGYARHDPSGHNSGNSRNGTISKQVQTGIGPVPSRCPGPGGKLRAGTGAQTVRAGLRRPGRHDHLAVCTRDERARHPAPP